jgi:antitoxin PrlF
VAESTITARGLTTVPAEVRQQVEAVTGTRLVWTVMPDATVVVRAKTKSTLVLAGLLKAPGGKRVAGNDMNAWR